MGHMVVVAKTGNGQGRLYTRPPLDYILDHQAMGCRPQATGYRPQAAGYRLQATGYRLWALGSIR